MEAVMWKNLKFSLKISVLVIVLIGFSVLTAVGYGILSNDIRDMGIKQSTDEMMQGYKSELKDIVDSTALSLSSAVKGVHNEKEIYTTFKKLVNNVRFFPDKSGYFFIYKVGGTVFVHPTKPNLEGKNIINFQDSNGTPLIQELDDAARRGGGFVHYIWPKPGAGDQPKLSYARMIPGQPYWIGTGVYIDNVKQKKDTIYKNISTFSTSYLQKLYIALAVLFVVLVAPLTFILIRSVVVPLTNLTQIADRFSQGKLDTDFPDLDRKDEIGNLAKALERLGTSTKIAMRKLAQMRQSAKVPKN
jgi:methyl-accepting chemotaxis protein